MDTIKIINIRDHAEMYERAVKWYGSKWGIPEKAYEESLQDCLNHPDQIPQWYLVMDQDKIAGGLGAIVNDFHKRTDLTPNVCAVFVEPEYRKQGIARRMLAYVCEDLGKMGIKDAYLTTDHTDFYEHCGWEFYGMIEENGGELARCYHIHIGN